MNKTASPAEPDLDFESLRDLIVERRSTMPRRLAQVAELVLAEPDEVALGTAATIAVRAGVQPSTLVRFSQMLGFTGFSALQAVCRRKLQRRWPDYEDRIEALRTNPKSDHTASLYAGFSEAAIGSILTLRERWDSARFEAAAKAIAKGKTIHLAGNRRSFPLTSYLAYLLGRLEIRYRLLAGVGDMDDHAMDTAEAGDVLIAVGFAPYAPATVEAARAAAARGVVVVSLTDSAFSPLAVVAKHWLEIAEQDFSGFRSLGASLCLCMTLAAHVGELRAGTAR